MKKEMMILAGGIVLALVLIQFASAGVGIEWNQESFLVKPGVKTCLNYSVYNPWPQDSYVQIQLSENLTHLLISRGAEIKLVPANTFNNDSIPVDFCFEVPQVYKQDCLIGGFLCKQQCNEEQKEYDGQVSVVSVPGNTTITGSGGSATKMSIAAPLRLKVVCNAHPTDYSLLYIVLAVIALVGMIIIIYRKRRKPEAERKKEKLAELKEEMKKLKRNK